MKRLVTLTSVLGLLLASCGRDSSRVDNEPDVAITRIAGPALATQQAPESGGSGSVGADYDMPGLIGPGAGPFTVAASNLYDPVTGQTTLNPLSVYVTASDELAVIRVELFQEGVSVGERTKDEDGVAFRNPFVFPGPNAQTSVTLQGVENGLLTTQLSAVATDSSGQTTASVPLELQVDGSRPDLNAVITGSNGSPYLSTDLITLTGSASDPETGIESFDVTLNGEALTVDGSNSFSATETLAAGPYTLLLTAVNGVAVPNQQSYFFQVEEDTSSTDPEDPSGGGSDTDNQAPTVSLLATPLEGDSPLNVSFTASANDLDGDEVTYLYNFGDGETTAGAPAASHTYTEDGTYTATVTVEDGKGGTASDSLTITVGDDDGDNDPADPSAPTVSIGGSEQRTATVGEIQDLEASTSNLEDSSFQWSVTAGDATDVSFGDATAEDTTVTFGAAGSYTLTLTATAGTTTASDTITVTVEASSGGGDGDDDNDGDDSDDDNGGVDAVNDSVRTDPGEAVTVRVLTNDEPGVQALTIVAATAPKQGGTVEISRDSRSITYTPPDGFRGKDTFRYTVTDRDGNRATATVSVQVGG